MAEWGRYQARMCAAVLVACSLAFAAGCAQSTSVEDGTYDIAVETDSNMFHVDSCELTVQDGAMTAHIVLPGSGFSRIFFGSSEAAAQAADADIFEYALDDAGKYTFDLPVSELDTELAVAAWGQRRDRWYDHTILFCSPDAATGASAASGAAVSSVPSEDGESTVAVTLEGGSGRASVESPAKVVTEGGQTTLTLVWSSPNFDKMVVDGVEYLPVNSSGNSTFEIPVSTFDEDLAIQAETTAMSEPHTIEYVLHFDGSTLQKTN